MKKMLNGEIVDCTPEEIAAIEDTNATIIAELEATAYIYARQDGYPSMEEQLDMQYWDSVNGTTVWADTIAAVKEANPKPE